jgi:small conductance mechanosensitive channel
MNQLLDFSSVIDNLKTFAALYGLKVFAALAILIIGRIVAGLLKRILGKVLQQAKVEPTLVTFIINLTYVGLIAFVVIAAIGKLGVQTTSFIAVLGAAGLAVGLALQGSLSNFAAGVLLIIFKPFKVTDFIEAGGAKGVVEEIGIFTTEIKTVDNKKVIIPNAKLTGDNIINYTAKESRRVDIVAGVGYTDDLDKVKEVLYQLMAEDKRVLKAPEPFVGLSELGDSSVNFTVRPWVKTADYWDVFFDLQENIKKRFDQEGISIPFPQRDVHLFKAG